MSDWARSARVRGGIALALVFGVAAAALAFAGRARVERADFAFTTGGDVASLDPHVVSGIPESRIMRALFEGLVSRDPGSLRPIPGAAERWQISNDLLTYTFILRDGVTWSNGDPLTAADFEWSFRRILEPETGSPNASLLAVVVGATEFASGAERDWSRVGIRALDQQRLEIRLTRPALTFLQILSSYPFVPVHRASMEALRAAHPSTWTLEWTRPENLVCNGPYRLLERRVNDRIRLVKNERYWDAANVSFATIDALAIENWTTALNLYLTGELDWIDGAIPSSAIPDLLGRVDFRTAAYQGLYFYRLNTTVPPFDDVRVRRALLLALKRSDLCKQVLRSGQTPAASFLPWGTMGDYQGGRLPAESVDDARKLLEQAGYGAKGRPFPPIEIAYNTGEAHRDIAEVVAAQWHSALGIEVHLANQEWKAFLDSQRNLDYQVSRSSWIADYDDPSTFLEIWTSQSENNRTGWKNAHYDDLIARARFEPNPNTRNALYYEAESILIKELPALPLYAYVSQHLVSPQLQGFYTNLLDEQFPKYWRWKDPTQVAAERANRMHLDNLKAAFARADAARRAAMRPPPKKKKAPPKPQQQQQQPQQQDEGPKGHRPAPVWKVEPERDG